MFRLSQQYQKLAFSDELVTMPPTRKKADIAKALANLTRYLDIKYDSYLHDEFTKWLKRKEIKWTAKPATDTYQIAKNLKMEEVLGSISKLPYKYKVFTLFVLVSGLRTEEAIRAFNNHVDLCNDGIMELFWDRVTKKTNAIYCHPLLHDKINFQVSKAIYHPKAGNLRRENLGFELKLLRKINFTINARIDPLLAEFMQGRRGNVSQRHYFLPAMQEHKQKWIEAWNLIIMNTIS